MNTFFDGLLVLLVCSLGGYFAEKEGFIRHPAHFVTWGYCFGILAGMVMSGVIK